MDMKAAYLVSAFRYQTCEGPGDEKDRFKGCPRECMLQCSDKPNDKWCTVYDWVGDKQAGWQYVPFELMKGRVMPYPVARYWKFTIISTYGRPAEILNTAFYCQGKHIEKVPDGYQKLKYEVVSTKSEVLQMDNSSKALQEVETQLAEDCGEKLEEDGTCAGAWTGYAPVDFILDLKQAHVGLTRYELVNTRNGKTNSHYTKEYEILVADEGIDVKTDEDSSKWTSIFKDELPKTTNPQAINLPLENPLAKRSVRYVKLRIISGGPDNTSVGLGHFGVYQNLSLADNLVDARSKRVVTEAIQQILGAPDVSKVDIFELLDANHDGSIDKKEWNMFNKDLKDVLGKSLNELVAGNRRGNTHPQPQAHMEQELEEHVFDWHHPRPKLAMLNIDESSNPLYQVMYIAQRTISREFNAWIDNIVHPEGAAGEGQQSQDSCKITALYSSYEVFQFMSTAVEPDFFQQHGINELVVPSKLPPMREFPAHNLVFILRPKMSEILRVSKIIVAHEEYWDGDPAYTYSVLFVPRATEHMMMQLKKAVRSKKVNKLPRSVPPSLSLFLVSLHTHNQTLTNTPHHLYLLL